MCLVDVLVHDNVVSEQRLLLGDIASTTNVKQDAAEKHRKGGENHKKSEELLSDPTPSESLASHLPSATEASDDEQEEVSKDITPGIEWIARVDMEREALKIS